MSAQLSMTRFAICKVCEHTRKDGFACALRSGCCFGKWRTRPESQCPAGKWLAQTKTELDLRMNPANLPQYGLKWH